MQRGWTVADDPVTAALMREYERYSGEIQRLFGQLERLVGLWMTVVTIAVGIGVKEKLGEVFVAVPVVVVGLMFYALTTHEFIAIGEGYTAALEDSINERFGVPVLIFQTRLAPHFSHRRPSLFYAAAYGVIAGLGAVGYSASRTFSFYPELFFIIQCPLGIGGAVVVVVHLLRVSGLRKRVRRESLRALRRDPPALHNANEAP